MELSSSVEPFDFPSKFSGLTSDSVVPVIDFSALIGGDPHQRSKQVHDLARACREWGFFILVNHGIPERLMNSTLRAVQEFFSLPESEKKQYEAKIGLVLDPIKCGNTSDYESSTMWRDYLSLHVHPEFHCPHQPQLLKEVVLEYTKTARNLATHLLQALFHVFELDQHYVDRVLNLDSSFQMFTANFYPPCPHPDHAIGIMPHTDPGFFTFLINNGVAGLQIEHRGHWFNVESPHNSILVNAADQLEIFSNGRCKSVKHRATVNEERERISVVVANGPSREAVVGPAAPLVEKDGRAMYRSIKYEDYLASKMTTRYLLEQQTI